MSRCGIPPITHARRKSGLQTIVVSDEAEKCRRLFRFVLACQKHNLNNQDMATHFRTYVNKNVNDSFNDCTIWEAGRATSAAPTYFPSMNVDGFDYVDGGLGFNNPVMM